MEYPFYRCLVCVRAAARAPVWLMGLKPRPPVHSEGIWESGFFFNSSPASGNSGGKQTSSHQHMHAPHTYPSILLWPWAHYTDIPETQRATSTLTSPLFHSPSNLRIDYGNPFTLIYSLFLHLHLTLQATAAYVAAICSSFWIYVYPHSTLYKAAWSHSLNSKKQLFFLLF